MLKSNHMLRLLIAFLLPLTIGITIPCTNVKQEVYTMRMLLEACRLYPINIERELSSCLMYG